MYQIFYNFHLSCNDVLALERVSKDSHKEEQR